MNREQLKALIEFIDARADEVVHRSVGLSGSDEAWSDALGKEKELYKAFGLDLYKEDSDV